MSPCLCLRTDTLPFSDSFSPTINMKGILRISASLIFFPILLKGATTFVTNKYFLINLLFLIFLIGLFPLFIYKNENLVSKYFSEYYLVDFEILMNYGQFGNIKELYEKSKSIRQNQEDDIDIDFSN